MSARGDRVSQITALLADGADVDRVVAVTGLRPSSLYTYCSHYIGMSGIPDAFLSELRIRVYARKRIGPSRSLSAETMRKIKAEAHQRNITAQDMIDTLITIIAQDNLFAAILDP